MKSCKAVDNIKRLFWKPQLLLERGYDKNIEIQISEWIEILMFA